MAKWHALLNFFLKAVPVSCEFTEQRLPNLFGADVEFDQAKGTQNQLKLQQHQNNLQRSNQLLATLDQRRSQYIDSVRELSLLQSRRAQLNAELPSPLPAQPPPDVVEKQKEIQKLDRLISIKTSERDALNAEITVINDQLKTIDTALSATAFQSVFANDNSPVPQFNGLLSKADIQAILGADKSPRLSASTALDSYIQLQYELIAKQLTLLRDEVGPNQRVIFLELPCSIYMSPKTADDSLAQVRWKVTKYLKEEPKTAAAYSQPTALSIEAVKSRAAKFQTVGENDPGVQVLDVIPRQSALNVAAVHNTVSGFNLSAKLVWLFGLGTKVGYQRQRELYNQFIYQELFASGFGKGEAEFGWTFGPLPGTKAIAPGLRTSYAVLSVPREAEALVLEGKGFSFSRKQTPDNSATGAPSKQFTLLIPREGNGFDLSSIDYVPVKSGEYLTAILRGNYFSPQVGVLVNGLPLSRVVAIASTPKGVRPPQNKAVGADSPPADPPPPPVGADVFDGQYEYISSETVILKWKMPPNYEGTPVITLVTPDFTSMINNRKLVINGIADRQLDTISVTEPMFFKGLQITGLSINGITAEDMVTAILQGNGFKPGAVITVNGNRVDKVTQISPQSYMIEFKKPFAQNWNFSVLQTLLQKTEQDTFSIQPGNTAITYEFINFDEPYATRKKATLDLRFRGGTVKTFDIKAKNPSQTEVTRLSSANESFIYRIQSSDNPVKLEIHRGGQVEKNLSVYWPLAPTIDKIINESEGPDGLANGKSEGGYRVRIIGKNLQLVSEVKFNNISVSQIQEQNNETITVTVPPGQGKVFVTLKTLPLLDGSPLTNLKDWDNNKGFFTYIAAQSAQNSP